MNAVIETKFAKLLSYGAALTTVLVIAGPVSDPVNVTKLLSLGIFCFALLPFFVYVGKSILVKVNPIPTYLSVFFAAASISALIFSEAPLVQNLYGVIGRNTGLVTLFLFLIIFLVSSNLTNLESIKFVVTSLLVAGGINVIYGFVNQYIGDPFPWTNIYGAFLGTFGNPNFAGAFLGLVFGASLAMALANLKNPKHLLIYGILFIASGIVVLFTKTTQGILVSGLTAGIVVLIYIYKSVSKSIFSHLSLAAFILTGFVVILGILQKGPLAQYLYKRSVSLRGVYWDTAIQVGNSHPLTGVGLDTFGDWYRTERSLKAATWLPGPETISNSAHNLYLDMYANGGLPLLITYTSFTVLGIWNIIRILKRINGFDPYAAILISVFIGFQAQSLISIAQIGIALWGWLIIGALHSYARIISSLNENSTAKSKKIKKLNPDSPVGVFMFVSAAIGLLLTLPPYSADAKYTNATKSQALDRVESTFKPSYFNPQFSQRIAMAAYLLEQNNFGDLAHKYALQGVKFNSHSYEAWKLLYILRNSTPADRELALSKMRELDPLNPNLEKLK